MSEPRPVPRRALIGRPGPLTVGIDIGGTKVLGAVVDPAGTVIALDRRPDRGPRRPQRSRTPSSTWSTASPREYDVAAVGIGAAGLRRRDPHRRDVLAAPGLAPRAAARRGSPSGCGCRSSSTTTPTPPRWPSAGSVPAAGHRFVLCVTLGTGIGGALVLDNRVYRGAQRHGGGVRSHAGRPRRPPVRVRQPRAAGSSTPRATRWSATPASWCGRLAHGAPPARRSSTATPTRSRARRSPRRPGTATRCRSSCSPTSAAGSASGWPGWRRRSTPAASSSAAASPRPASC